MKSTPNPLNPQGSLLEQEANGKPHLRVGLIIAGVHVLLFVGILIQGCGNETPGNSPDDTYSTYSQSSSSSSPKEDEVVAPKDLEYYTSSSSTNQDVVVPGNSGASGNSGANAMQAPQIGLNSSADSGSSSGANDSGRSSSASAGMTEYVIQRGDSFYKIAQDHGVTVARLTEANPGFDPKKLQVGQKLKIPAAAAAVATPRNSAGGGSDAGSASGNFYVVKRGDTLSSIASSNKTTVSQLKSANNLKTDQIRVGQKLQIP